MFGVGAADAARGPGLIPGLGTVICAIHTWCSQPQCAPQDEQEKKKTSRVSLFLMHEKFE